MIPEPVTPPERDAGLRRQSAFDLEVTLVGFLTKLFAGARLDNPTLNLAQATEPLPLIVLDPDQPPVSYDPATRMQTLALKQPPRVLRGRVPRTVTGEIALDKLPDVPNIIVQAIKAKVEQPSTIVTVRILFSTYDENPDSSGYQDCLNLIETAALALTSFGQQGIDQAYPMQMPLEWTLVEPDCFPHYVGEMTTTWELPSARPLPDDVLFDIVPVEHIDLQATYPGDSYPPPPAPYVPPPLPPLLLPIDSWGVENQNDIHSYGVIFGGTNYMVACGQAFPTAGATLTAVKFSLLRIGNPTGNLFARLYAATGVFPKAVATGAPLAESTPVAVADISPDATDLVGMLYEFQFPGGYVMPAGNYCILLESDMPPGDFSNYIGLGCDFDFDFLTENPGHAGNFAGRYVNSGDSADDLCDAIFYLYAMP